MTLREYKLGKMTDDEYWTWAAKEWKLDMTTQELTQLLVDSYSVDPHVEAVVKSVRANGYKTLICSKCDTKPAPKTTLEEDTCNGVTDIDEVLPALQEIMLGMLPEEDDVKPGSAAKMKSGEFVYGHKAGWNAAIKLIEQNIRGGFNNG